MTTPGNTRMDTMELPIGTLSITGFRSLRELKAGPFGRVNLITGKNNSGKSSLLEAIRIFVTQGSPRTFFEILDYREEFLQKPVDVEQGQGPDDATAFCSLFTGFPPLKGNLEPFVISNQVRPKERRVTMSVRIAWYLEKIDSDGITRLLPIPTEGEVVSDSRNPYLELTFPGVPIRIVRIRLHRRMGVPRDVSPRVGPPCLLVDPFTALSTGQFATLWDAVALTDSEQSVIKALRLLSPDIQAVSMIGVETPNRARTAIVKSSRFANPIPLRNLGDGLNRLFGIILSLTCARAGVLLIDEVENGLHYSVLADVWKVIFHTARDLGVQVFATTHSWDCIKAFQAAAQEAPDEGVLVRLTARGETVHSTLFREDELRIATQELIEVR